MNSKGVSETLGYFFIFGVVITTVAYAFIHVTGVVQDISDKYKVEGFRESFKRIQNVFFLSAYGGAPMQTLQVEMQGGKFYLSSKPKLKIEIVTDDGAQNIIDADIGALNFEYGNYNISIENGAVYENYYSYQRTLVDPRIFIHQMEVQGTPGSFHKVLTMIVYKVSGNLSVSGMGALEMIFASKLNNSILEDRSGVVVLTIENSAFSNEWCKYFTSLTNSVSCDSGNVIASILFDKLVIAIFDVDVRYRILS
ncbi:MAG: hypothetical protein QXY19_06270 [Archaeoglobaceae archaeon]